MTISDETPMSVYTFRDPDNGHNPSVFPTLETSPTKDLSVVVPAYNESKRLPQMLNETLDYLVTRANQPTDPVFTFEVIIVDDGSKDNTVDVAYKYTVHHGSDLVRVLKLERNQGKGAAVRAGVISSRGRYILMADADAATVFADIEKLEQAASLGAHVAIGSRAHLKGQQNENGQGRSFIRGFISSVFNFVVVYVGGVTGIKDTQCGFKLYQRDAARAAFQGQNLMRWAFDVENLYRVQTLGYRMVEVPVQWTEVPGSKLSVVKATVNMLIDMVKMRYSYSAGKWLVGPPARIGT